MPLSIIILVVVYKKGFLNSETLMNIEKISTSGIFKNSKLIIWDNTPKDSLKNEIDLMNGNFLEIHYIHTPQNESLSKIYNNVAHHYLKKGEYLLLLDHDTTVTLDYFKEIIEVINLNSPPDLLLPLVFVHGAIESPAYHYYLFSKKWNIKNKGLYKSKYVTAINSGMVISERFFSKGFRYDERLEFYGTDNYLMLKYSQYNKEFYLLGSRLIHELNLLSNISINQKVAVFKAIKKANLIVNSSNLFLIFLTRLNNLIISIKYSIKYNSLEFLK